MLIEELTDEQLLSPFGKNFIDVDTVIFTCSQMSYMQLICITEFIRRYPTIENRELIMQELLKRFINLHESVMKLYGEWESFEAGVSTIHLPLRERE